MIWLLLWWFELDSAVLNIHFKSDCVSPQSTKEEILRAVFAGEKVHKVSPAFPVSWTTEEVNLMAKHVYEIGVQSKAQQRQSPTEIPAVNYKNEPIPGGILGWLNRVRTRRILKQNPHHPRLGRIRPGSKSNRQLWRETSTILLEEYKYWVKQLHKNRVLISEGRGYLCKYPKIGGLPFRCNNVFLGGEWSQFSSFWEPFIDAIR